VSWGLAFTAGLFSFLSPCVAPVVPGYLSFLSGAAIGTTMSESRQTERVLIASLLFVLGFAAVFVALGATAGAVGALLSEQRAILNRLSGLVMIAMGLFVLGAFSFAPLLQDRRVQLIDRPYGALSTVAVGMAFGFGWTPCIGPVLASILLYAGATETAQDGAVLLLIYSLGLGLPFVLAALGVNQTLLMAPCSRRILPIVSRASGLLLIGLGGIFVTNQIHLIAYLNGVPQIVFERLMG
jgi:cytochrome c-type biogenesis protein